MKLLSYCWLRCLRTDKDFISCGSEKWALFREASVVFKAFKYLFQVFKDFPATSLPLEGKQAHFHIILLQNSALCILSMNMIHTFDWITICKSKEAKSWLLNTLLKRESNSPIVRPGPSEHVHTADSRYNLLTQHVRCVVANCTKAVAISNMHK